MATLDYQTGRMPGLIQELAALSDPATAIRFARKFGGQKLYVPKKIWSAHPLVKCIGRNAAQRMVQIHGGEDWTVPSAANYLTWLDTRVLRVCGLSRNEIAEKLDITVSHVGRLVAGFDAEAVEITDIIRSIAKLYRVGRLARAERPSAATPQTDFGWPCDRRGMRLRG